MIIFEVFKPHDPNYTFYLMIYSISAKYSEQNIYDMILKQNIKTKKYISKPEITFQSVWFNYILHIAVAQYLVILVVISAI